MKNVIKERFNKLLVDNNLSCTQDDFDEFLVSGLIFKYKDCYLTRNNTKINIDIISTKVHNMNLNFQRIIQCCEELNRKNYNNKRVFCMTLSSYNKYKEQGLIIKKENKDYYRIFEQELWLVQLI